MEWDAVGLVAIPKRHGQTVGTCKAFLYKETRCSLLEIDTRPFGIYFSITVSANFHLNLHHFIDKMERLGPGII